MIHIFVKRLFDIELLEWEKKRDLSIELTCDNQTILSTELYEDVLDEVSINARCSIPNTGNTSVLYLSVRQDEVLTQTILSKIRIPVPENTCSKTYKLSNCRPIQGHQSPIIGKIEMGFQYVERKQCAEDETTVTMSVSVSEQQDQLLNEKLDRMDAMIRALQSDLKYLQQQHPPVDELPHFLQLGDIPPITLRSVVSGKQLRITHSGRVDTRGDYGQMAQFKIIRIGQQDIRLQSLHNPKRHVRIDNMHIDGLGGKGHLTVLKAHYMGKYIFAFESAHHPNHFLAADVDGRCMVVIGDQPHLTRFTILMNIF